MISRWGFSSWAAEPASLEYVSGHRKTGPSPPGGDTESTWSGRLTPPSSARPLMRATGPLTAHRFVWPRRHQQLDRRQLELLDSYAPGPAAGSDALPTGSSAIMGVTFFYLVSGPRSTLWLRW